MLCGTDERMTKELIALGPSTVKIKVIRRGLERSLTRRSQTSSAETIGLKDVPASYDECIILVKGGKFKD